MDILHNIASNIDWLMILMLFALNIVDYISGISKGVVEKRVKSAVMFYGGKKYVGQWLVVLLAFVIEVFSIYLPDLPFRVDLIPIVCSYLMIMEITSVLENATIIYPELTRFKFFQIFGVKENGEGEDTDA